MNKFRKFPKIILGLILYIYWKDYATSTYEVMRKTCSCLTKILIVF